MIAMISIVPSLGSGRAYLSSYPSLCLFVWSSMSLFGNHKNAAYNCVQHMWLQATGSKTLSGSIIRLYICPLVCPWAFFDFVFVLIYSVGVQWHNAFIIPTMRSKGPQWGPVEPIYLSLCPYLCLSISLSGHMYHILEIIHMARNCAQCIQPQATGSNTPIESIICLSVRFRFLAGLLRFLYLY